MDKHLNLFRWYINNISCEACSHWRNIMANVVGQLRASFGVAQICTEFNRSNPVKLITALWIHASHHWSSGKLRSVGLVFKTPAFLLFNFEKAIQISLLSAIRRICLLKFFSLYSIFAPIWSFWALWHIRISKYMHTLLLTTESDMPGWWTWCTREATVLCEPKSTRW